MSSTTSKILFLILMTLKLSSLSGIASAQKTGQGIIDVHTHLIPDLSLNFENAVEIAIRRMDRFGIETSILMSPPRKPGIKQNYDMADFRNAVAKYPGRFVLFAGGGTLNLILHGHTDPRSVTPKVKQEFAAKARRLIDAGARGFGEMSGLHVSLAAQHRYTFVPADHPLLLTLADVAAEKQVPIDLHMDAVASSKRPPKRLSNFLNNPKKIPATLPALERLLSHNRKAKIIWAHGGTDHIGDFGPKTIRRFMDKHSNLYVSLKVTSPKAPTKNKLFSRKKINSSWLSLLKRHSSRFVIGTDNFYTDPSGYGPPIEFSKLAAPRLKATSVFLSRLPSKLRKKISRDNAINLYRLEASDTATTVTSTITKAHPKPPASGGLCRDGNMAHCKFACERGIQPACRRLKRGF